MMVTGQIQWTDLLEAERLRNQPSSVERTGIVVIAILAALALVFTMYKVIIGEVPVFILWLGMLLVVIFLVPYFVIQPFQIWWLYRSRKDLRAPFQVTVQERGIDLDTEFGSTLWYWNKFANWRESDRLVVLYQPNGSYCLLPKRSLSDQTQLDLVRQKLRDNHIPVFSKPTNWSTAGMIWLFVILALLLVVLNLAGVD